MSNQQQIVVKKPIYCRNEGCHVEIEFDPNRKSKSGRLIPIEKSSGVGHNCKFSAYNLQKNGTTVVKTPAEISSTITQIEMQELNTKLTKIESQLTKLLEQYNVKMDGLTGE